MNEHFSLKQDYEATKSRARKMLEDKDEEISRLKGGKVPGDSGASQEINNLLLVKEDLPP
jgi:hypothetical protein